MKTAHFVSFHMAEVRDTEGYGSQSNEGVRQENQPRLPKQITIPEPGTECWGSRDPTHLIRPEGEGPGLFLRGQHLA